MEYTNEFTNLKNTILIKHLEYKREFIKDENELNIIDLKLKELKSNSIIAKKEDKDIKNSFLDKIDNDFQKYALFKTWNRLTKEQKILQLKLYLDNLIDAENITNIKEVLVQYLECGILSNKYIVYDSKTAKISNIKCLQFDNDTNSYRLEIKKKIKKVKSV